MTTLYNLHHIDLADYYRITKFVDGNPEGSYLVTLTTCECPAGHRPSCRHRKMLPLMLERHLLDSSLFWDFDGGFSCDMNGKAMRITAPTIEPANAREAEESAFITTITAQVEASVDTLLNPPAPTTPAIPWRRI